MAIDYKYSVRERAAMAQALAHLRTGSPLGGASAEELIKQAADALDPRMSRQPYHGLGYALPPAMEAARRLNDAIFSLGKALGVRQERLTRMQAVADEAGKAAKRGKKKRRSR